LGRFAGWLPLAILATTLSLYAQDAPSMRAGVADSVQAGRQQMEAGNYPAAEALYRQALAQSPGSAPIETALALSLQMQGHSAEAIHYYSLALKQQYVPETYALLAQQRCRMGEVDLLKPMLARIYREQRNNPRVLAAVAPCFLDADEPVESVDIYEHLLQTPDYPPDQALIESAKSYIRSGQFFATSLSKTPGAEPYLQALREAPTAGADGARSAFGRAAASSPYFRSNLTWSEALERLHQHPHDPALLYLLAVLSADQGMRQVTLCDQRYPSSPYLEQFHADVLADQGQGDQAIAEYQQLLEQHAALADLAYNLGLLHQKRSEWDQAAAAFRQQLANSPGDERAQAHLSSCLLAMSQYAELRSYLEPQMRLEHPPEWARLDLAQAEEKLGDRDAAIRTLVAAEQQPSAPKLVHYRLMHLYTTAGRAADAQREYSLFQAASAHPAASRTDSPD
jgi:tetratricopeptide (TPR) repeat protein